MMFHCLKSNKKINRSIDLQLEHPKDLNSKSTAVITIFLNRHKDPGPGYYDVKSAFNKKYEFKVLNKLIVNEKSNPFKKVFIN